MPLKLRNEPVALFLVDQRMPHMSGVEFLEQAIPLYPEAKRALLTAYADTDAAIRAINSVQIDHYLMKPWDPPEERLYGVVVPNFDLLRERKIVNTKEAIRFDIEALSHKIASTKLVNAAGAAVAPTVPAFQAAAANADWAHAPG